MNSALWRRSAAALAATVPALLSTSACKVDGDDGFRIAKVEFDNDSKITLTFTEPVADLSGVNPDDFRLSIGQTSSYSYTYEGVTYTYEYTAYVDVSYILGGYDYNSSPPFRFMEVAAGASADQIILRTTDALGPEVCDWLDQAWSYFEMYADDYDPGARFDMAIFLHYAGGDVPIESDAGEVLGDIGADWVLSDQLSVYRESYGFTMSPQLRIPCP